MSSDPRDERQDVTAVEYDVAPELARLYAIEDCERFIEDSNALVRERRAAAERGDERTASRLADLIEASWPPADAVARTARLLGDPRRFEIEPFQPAACSRHCRESARSGRPSDPPASSRVRRSGAETAPTRSTGGRTTSG